ncbi:MAG: UDP-N-acetylglucosamine--N-acetylmuramyl-(pentapeptide) pyrophosphoryl-undecaprenol N-acetylglucosamine transferase [Kiritimatiellia bacterium]
MKIAIACGGTGGHIFPGLATADILRARGHAVTLWLGGKDIEKKALAGWDGATVTIEARGWPARPGPECLAAFLVNIKAFGRALRRMRASPPAALLAMGGYASLAPVMAARALSVPVVLHEANVIPGKANLFLSRFAQVFALGFEETRGRLSHRKMIYTGIPLRRPAAEEGGAWNALKPGVFTILVTGGSRGARSLNEITARAVISLHRAGNELQVIHLAGSENESAIRQAYLEAGVAHAVFAFLHGMASAFNRASFVICRAGGSTCAELAQFGLPALLVPYPHAAANHQLFNARALEEGGAADVIEENNCSAGRLADYIRGMMSDSGRLDKMRAAARKRADRDAAGALADAVIEAAGNEGTD